jgi:hypothetical protein
MPSRKRAQGKARNGPAQAQAKAKTKQLAATATATETNTNTNTNWKCIHGCVPWHVDVCKSFAQELSDKYDAAVERGDDYPFDVAFQATSAKEEYDEMLGDASKMKLLVSYLVSLGTQHQIINESLTHASIQTSRFCAYLACFLEEYISCELNETQAFINTNKMRKVAFDEHTLISYFKHRIPCKCLDEVYKQVKSTKKMGFCYNKDCCHPIGLVERSSLLNCTRCRFAEPRG